MSLTVWKDLEVNHIYCMGVDTAEGLAHGDFSCIQVLDVRTSEQVAVWHGHIPPDELAEEVYNLGMWYNRALCCVESNNHGLTTIVQLRHLGYPNMFRKRSLNQVTDTISQEFGWKTNRTSKPLLIDDLGIALRNDELTLYDRFTVAELRSYVRNDRGTMSGSPHDDRVMALALSNQMRQYAFMPEYAPVVDDYWTINWFARMITENEKEASENRSGASTVRGSI